MRGFPPEELRLAKAVGSFTDDFFSHKKDAGWSTWVMVILRLSAEELNVIEFSAFIDSMTLYYRYKKNANNVCRLSRTTKPRNLKPLPCIIHPVHSCTLAVYMCIVGRLGLWFIGKSCSIAGFESLFVRPLRNGETLKFTSHGSGNSIYGECWHMIIPCIKS